MLKDDVIYNSSFRFRDINFDNINDIYLAINIIVIIAITFLETLIIIVFIFEFIIVIVFDVDDVIIIIIIVFEKFVLKFIAFDFDIKKRFIMNVLFNKS